jgi:hypothetical protein
MNNVEGVERILHHGAARRDCYEGLNSSHEKVAQDFRRGQGLARLNFPWP